MMYNAGDAGDFPFFPFLRVTSQYIRVYYVYIASDKE
jgi:hypothetical protein